MYLTHHPRPFTPVTPTRQVSALTTGRPRAFTLVELLVTLAILGIVATLLMPALARAQAKARNLSCVSNLRQLGLMTRVYAEDHQGVLPSAEALPSQPADPARPLARIADLLSTPGQGGTQAPSGVFRCPEDRAKRWATEGTSYEWNSELSGRRIDETRNAQVHLVTAIRQESGDVLRSSTNATLEFPPSTTPLLFNFDPLHPRAPRSARNAVFMDGHVESLDGMLR